MFHVLQKRPRGLRLIPLNRARARVVCLQGGTPLTSKEVHRDKQTSLKLRYLVLSLGLVLLGGESVYAGVDDHRVRVRVRTAVPQVQVHGFDLAVWDGTRRWTEDQMTRLEVRCSQGRVSFQRAGQPHQSVPELQFRSPTGFLRLDARPYREEIRVRPSIAREGCDVINVVDLEKYLDGLVNAEFNAEWSEEAVAAQVIAARTYALHQMRQARKNSERHFDVESTVLDQVYDGPEREHFKASRSVEKTSGMVLVAQTDVAAGRSLPIKAFYHSTCGGRTDTAEAVWGGFGARYSGVQKSVPCGFCRSSPRYEWGLKLSAEEIRAALVEGARVDGGQKAWPSDWRSVLAQGRLVDMRVTESTRSGRAKNVRMLWKVGTRTVDLSLSAAMVRKWVGSTRMLSTSFGISKTQSSEREQFVFAGRGFGHGVGMCQWGAKTMGEKGFNVTAILKHYYPQALIKKLW